MPGCLARNASRGAEDNKKKENTAEVDEVDIVSLGSCVSGATKTVCHGEYFR